MSFNSILTGCRFCALSSPQSSDSLMSSFLLYGDDQKTWKQVWCVITRAEPLTLCLYMAPQVHCMILDVFILEKTGLFFFLLLT